MLFKNEHSIGDNPCRGEGEKLGSKDCSVQRKFKKVMMHKSFLSFLIFVRKKDNDNAIFTKGDSTERK